MRILLNQLEKKCQKPLSQKLVRFVLFCFACLQYPVALAHATEPEKATITWVAFEQAPYFVLSGKLKGQGVGDYLIDTYQAALPQFNHAVQYVSYGRYLKAVKAPNICVPMAWSHAEEAHLLHSRPHTIEPPMGLMALASTPMPTMGEVYSLGQVMAETSYRLKAYKQFLYGAETENLLKYYETLGRVLYQNNEQLEVNTMVLDRRRADVAMALPGQMASLRANGKAEAYRFYPITEIANYVRLMSHCSDDRAGREALSVIDGMLTPDFLEDLLQRYQYWYPDNKDFSRLYRGHIIEEQDMPAIGDYFTN